MPQRKSIDCRDYPSEKHCSLKISGTEEEVLDAAVHHAAPFTGTKIGRNCENRSSRCSRTSLTESAKKFSGL